MSSLWLEQKEHLTEKQIKELDRIEARIENICGQDVGRWHIALEPESRPGRGHDISAWATDGEFMATAYVDVYGSGQLVVSAIELIHNDSDEDHFDEYGDCEHEM